MQPAGTPYERVRRILKSRQGLGLIAFVTIIEVLTALALLVTLALVVGLLDTRGETYLAGEEYGAAPRWLQARIPVPPTGQLVKVTNTGLAPLIIQNQRPGTPWTFGVGASALRSIVARVRPLQSNLSALLTLLTVSLVLLVLFLVVMRTRWRMVMDAAADTASSLRRQIHRQVYRLGRSALPNEGTGPVVNLFTREVNDVEAAMRGELEGEFRLILLIFALFFFSLALSWQLTIFFLSLFSLVALIARPLRRMARDQAEIAVRAEATQLLLLHEDLELVRTVRVYGMESIDKDRFDAHLKQYMEADIRRGEAESGVPLTMVMLYGSAAIIGLGLLGVTVLALGVRSISPAAALVLVICLLAMTRFLLELFRRRRERRLARRSAAAIFEYLDRRPDLLMPPEAQFLPPMHQAITFENVALETASGHSLFSGVSAEIPAGSRVAIACLEEEPKLALACLIPRLMDPSIGRVRIDGHDLREVTLESLRAQVATVFQADLIFSDTVLANINLGDPSYGHLQVIEAAKFTHAHHFIQELPMGYETVIGPLGHPLSTDEQFRIALARAYLYDPAIVIIEEPTAPIDDQIKPLIDDTIDRLAKNRTIFFLPHRLSTIRRCDFVLVLHNGRLEDFGPPREVTKRSKLYRHIQYVEFNKFATGELEVGQMEP